MRAAIQMDALTSLNFNSDSTLMLAHCLQLADWQVFYYHPSSLCYDDGEVKAQVTPLSSKWLGHSFSVSEGETKLVALKTFQLVLIRQDPPVDLNYITACNLLHLLPATTTVLNKASSILQCPEKLSVLNFPQYTPPTLISYGDEQSMVQFIAQQQQVVIKPLYGYGGQDVHLITVNQLNQARALSMQHGAIILQRFLADVQENGDKRVFMINGEIIGSFQRMPAAGSITANLAAGGSAHPTVLTAKELQICLALSPFLRKHQLFFAGIDLLAEQLIEINITSPTGLTTLCQMGLTTPEAISSMVINGLREVSQC